MLPELDGIDHVHVYVQNREKAAVWYEKTLGFKISESLAFWAKDSHGPLTIEDPAGKIHLALFGSDNFTPSTAIAFRANGENFLEWKTLLENKKILLRCADHTVAWSLYFNDLDGNMHEITTYDYDYVSEHFSSLKPAEG